MGKQTFGQFAIEEPVLNFAGGGKTARVEIFGAIGWEVYANDFLKALNALPAEVTDLDVRIHSYGGEVTEGWAIAQALRNHKASVTGTIDGTAASMGSVIAMSCDRLVMPKNSYLMIHRVAGGAWGSAEEVEGMGKTIRKMEDDIVAFYAEKTGIEADEIREMMAAETWMNGAEALEKGFCHEVIDEVAAVAFAGERNVVEGFSRVPEAVALANGLGSEEENRDEQDEQDESPEEGEGQPEEVGEVEETEEPGESEEEAPEGSAVGRVMNTFRRFLNGGGDGRSEGVAALTAENARLIAEGERLSADLAAAVMERDELRGRVSMMETEARSVEAVIAECGFTHAEASDLPGPEDDGEAVTPPEGSVLDQLNAMEPGVDRSEFFEAHKREILAAYSADAVNQ